MSRRTERTKRLADWDPDEPRRVGREGIGMLVVFILVSVVLAAVAQLTLKHGMTQVTNHGQLPLDLKDPVGIGRRVLANLSVWLGLAMSTRLLGTKRQKALLGLHRTLAWTGLSMIGLHGVAILFDPTLHFGLASLLVPFARSPWGLGLLPIIAEGNRRRRDAGRPPGAPGGLPGRSR